MSTSHTDRAQCAVDFAVKTTSGRIFDSHDALRLRLLEAAWNHLLGQLGVAPDVGTPSQILAAALPVVTVTTDGAA